MRSLLMATMALLLALPGPALSQASMVLFSETPPTHPKSQLMTALAAQITEASEGRIVAEYFSSESGLFDSADAAIDALLEGKVQMLWPTTGRLERFSPEFSILTLPYSVDTLSLRDAEARERLSDALSGLLADDGLSAIGLAPTSNTLFVSKEPLTSPDDLVGKTVRVPGSPMLMDFIAAFGGTSVAIPAPRLPDMLGAGDVDVVMTSFSGWRMIGPEDGAYVVLDRDMRVGLYVVTVNESWLDALDPADRRIVLEETRKVVAQRWDDLEGETGALQEEMEAAGTTFSEISDEESSLLREAAATVRDQYLPQSPAFLTNHFE